MSMLPVRSGVPEIRRLTFDQDGMRVDLRGVTSRLKIRSTAQVHIYFTQEAFEQDIDYIDLPGPANLQEWGEDVAVRYVWIRALVGSADVEITAAMTIGN